MVVAVIAGCGGSDVAFDGIGTVPGPCSSSTSCLICRTARDLVPVEAWVCASITAAAAATTGSPGSPPTSPSRTTTPSAEWPRARGGPRLGRPADRRRGASFRAVALLGNSQELYLTGTERRCLEIAASFAADRAISLSGQVTRELGWAHARRVLEAITIATRTTELLQVAGTAKLAELKALDTSLSAGEDRH